MCDLIDLNSPDPRKLLSSKLASPLIPGPATPVNNETKKEHNISFVCHGKRSSLENNPFDKVFKETTEYTAKKEDPFEAVLEKAMRSETQNARKQHHYAEQREECTPKRRRHSEVLKMNKTLDEPLLREIMNRNLSQLANQSWRLEADKSIVDNMNNLDLSKDNMREAKLILEGKNSCRSPSVIVFPPSPQNSSLLNQSAMNDSLSEVGNSLPGKQIGEGNTDTTASVDLDSLFFRSSKHRRSLSQGDKKSPESPRRLDTGFRPRSRSIADTMKLADLLNKSRGSSLSSISPGNSAYANNAFIETGCSSNAESLDLSKISGAPRLNLGSLGSVSSLYSYSSMNRAFLLGSQSSAVSSASVSSFKSSLNSSTALKGPDVVNRLVTTPLKTPLNINDLEQRFDRLKLQSLNKVQELACCSPNSKVKSFLQQDEVCIANTNEENYQGNETSNETETKLIDADIFVPSQKNFESEDKRIDSASNCSSDSVFVENDKIDQSVFREAKLLARTFDELAQQSNSSSLSSPDDFLSNQFRWNFDVLPVSDDDGDEAVVDNLIELPTSPVKDDADNQNPLNIESDEATDAKASENIKQLETEFIDQDVAKNKVMAASLLLDLEKIIHRENNAEAITLLENLEKVLGVKYESNAQLLATCMQGTTNNLSKSPKKSITELGSEKNIRRESLENSHEDNDVVQVSNSNRIFKVCDDATLGMNLNVEKAINKSDKYIMPDFSVTADENKENFSEKSNNYSNVEDNVDKETSVDQIEALELITNLSKILGGRNNDSSPLSLLANLRQVLNLATNQLNFENSQIKKTENKNEPIDAHVGTEVLRKRSATSAKVGEKKFVVTCDPNKSGRKKSIDSIIKEKNFAPVLIKRSMSLSGAQGNTTPTAALSREKARQHTRTFKKSFSCEAVPKAGTLDKLSSVVKEVDKGRASAVNGNGKYKLKKKTEIENVTGKKGPLKALVPMGNMQRRGSLSMKVAPVSGSRTPPKSSSNVPCAFTAASSSTPNPTVAFNVSKKSPKSKPVASSTPEGGASRVRKIKLQISKNMPKPKFSCNISPVTPLPTHSFTGNAGSKGGSPKNNRHNRTLSPKRQDPEEAQAHNATLSSIPKYSPLAGFSRKNSKETIKTLENSGSPKLSAKSQTPKKKPFVHSKSESQIPQSPLKTMNNQNAKYKPFNLISKLRRGSSGSTVTDKENCA